jgi:hypothetical protein
LFHPIFAVAGLFLLTKEFGKRFQPLQHFGWVIGGVPIGVLAMLAYRFFDSKTANFISHAVGGGMVSIMSYQYCKAHLQPRWSWRVDFVVAMMAVATMGVLNELAEYAAELARISVFSFDTHDVWRDFAANSLGAIAMWAIIGLLQKISSKR